MRNEGTAAAAAAQKCRCVVPFELSRVDLLRSTRSVWRRSLNVELLPVAYSNFLLIKTGPILS